VADVVKTAVPLRNWVAVTSGYDIDHLLTRYCDNAAQRRLFYYYMLNKVFSSICFITGPPSCALLDVPGSGGTDIADFMKIGNSVMRGTPASVRLGIAHAGRVKICIYDVAGRRVRTLADRVFPAGEQVLRWDGTDDGGTKVGRGVYFVRSSNDTGTGRIIVLNR
jgi:hypothetical protein